MHHQADEDALPVARRAQEPARQLPDIQREHACLDQCLQGYVEAEPFESQVLANRASYEVDGNATGQEGRHDEDRLLDRRVRRPREPVHRRHVAGVDGKPPNQRDRRAP